MPRKIVSLPPLDSEDTLCLQRQDEGWCVIGDESGYCYAGPYKTKEEAERFLLESLPQRSK